MKLRRTAALVAIALCAFEVTASSEIQLLPAGEFRGMDGRPVEVDGWKLDGTIAARVIARSVGRQTRYVIDYEHQTLKAGDNAQPAPAAGWFSRLEWREGVGLFALDVEWTERAKAMIEAKEYRYLSPVFVYNTKTGEVIEVLLAALTNTPNLDGMAEVAQRAAASFNLSSQGDLQVERTLLAALIAALGIAENTSEQDAVTAVAAMKAKADKLPEIETQLAAAKQQVADPGKFVSLETHNKVVEQVSALSTKLDTRDLDDVIDVAMSDGRLPAAEEDWARKFAKDHGIAALTESLSKRQAIPALARQQTEGRRPQQQHQGELSNEQLAVCKQLGLKPEDYKAQLATSAA